MRGSPAHNVAGCASLIQAATIRHTNITAAPNSATAQFYINVADNPRLDTFGGGYAVFGKVVEGLDVVDRIKAVPTAPKAGHENVPQQAIVIKQASLLEK